MASKRFAVPALMEPSRRSLAVLARPVTALLLLLDDRHRCRGQGSKGW